MQILFEMLKNFFLLRINVDTFFRERFTSTELTRVNVGEKCKIVKLFLTFYFDVKQS